jgi:hypothetical protein
MHEPYCRPCNFTDFIFSLCLHNRKYSEGRICSYTFTYGILFNVAKNTVNKYPEGAPVRTIIKDIRDSLIQFMDLESFVYYILGVFDPASDSLVSSLRSTIDKRIKSDSYKEEEEETETSSEESETSSSEEEEEEESESTEEDSELLGGEESDDDSEYICEMDTKE